MWPRLKTNRTSASAAIAGPGHQGAWPSADGQALLHFFGLFLHFLGVLAKFPRGRGGHLHAGFFAKNRKKPRHRLCNVNGPRGTMKKKTPTGAWFPNSCLGTHAGKLCFTLSGHSRNGVSGRALACERAQAEIDLLNRFLDQQTEQHAKPPPAEARRRVASDLCHMLLSEN